MINVITRVQYYWQQIKYQQRIHTQDIALFLRQLATLLSAGIPIIQCCESLEKSQNKIALRVLIFSIKREMLAGKTLFYSMRKHRHYFDELTCQLIQIGKHTGRLDLMLNSIAHHHEKNLALKKRLQQALFYPCIVSIIALMITLAMFIFIIPKFANLFNDTQDKLPLLTLAIFFLAHVLQKYIVWMLALVGLGVLFVTQSQQAKYAYQKLKIHSMQLPFLKFYLQKIILARFTRHLGMTLDAGLPITDALTLCTSLEGKKEFIETIAKVRSKICTGLSLHLALDPHFFPTLMIQMIKIGEESGTLIPMLVKLAQLFEADVDHLINQLNQLLEPLLMIMLGVLIGGLVIGMYLPLFKLGSAL